MGLYGNLFLVGTIYGDDGSTLFANAAGNLISQQNMIDAVRGSTTDGIDKRPRRPDRRAGRGRPELPDDRLGRPLQR